jgi:hypothetical protein
MNASIPKINPKGTVTGDFSGVNYTSADPDCWWSWSKVISSAQKVKPSQSDSTPSRQCTTPKVTGLRNDITRCEQVRYLD